MQRPAAPRGTCDILPDASRRWQALERIVAGACARYGYGEIRTPIFESTEVFVRSIGEGTDIVEKEMYTFTDRGGRSLTLRPEFTAPVVRAALEHNMLEKLPLKVYYGGPIFRYERPQKGRFRQAHQWGAECFGIAQPEADVEIVALAVDVLRGAGIAEYTLTLNSLGCAACRQRYREALVVYLRARADDLSATSRVRLATNPLRILDSKDPGDRVVIAQAPTNGGYLCDECAAHFAQVQELLAGIGIPYEVDPRMVRGLDYYTRTVFEISAGALGAQNAVCGGGRYDELVASMGGPDTPGVGVAMGMERLLMVAEAAGSRFASERAPSVALLAMDRQSARALVPLLYDLRGRGIAADMDHTFRKLSAQLRDAGERGARLAVIVGDEERGRGVVTLQDLLTRERQHVTLDDAPAAIAARL